LDNFDGWVDSDPFAGSSGIFEEETDDYAAFITSEGQVAVYSGADPASSTTWSLVGVFDIGAPIGRRC
jgi:hypothetical protein